jgi:hypothetical protein
MRGIAAGAHLDEDQGAVVLAQDQVDLAATRMMSGGDPIIALDQLQALLLQIA